MYKTLKLKGDESKYFFCSDLHLFQTCEHWDNPLWKMRGYSSIEEHTEGLIKAWNSVCDENSTVFCLGDLAFQDPDGKKLMEVFRRLKFGTLQILRGNHCSSVKFIYDSQLKIWYPDAHKNGVEVYPLWVNFEGSGKILNFWPEYLEVFINNVGIVMCHYPILSWNNMSKGSWMLGGHCHGADSRHTLEATGYGKIVDLGIENLPNHAPISLIELKRIMARKEYVQIGHH